MTNIADIVKTRFIKLNQDFDRMIEIDCNTSGPYIWEPEDLYNEMKKNWTVGMVAVDSEDYPLGFCVYSLNEPGIFEIKHLVVDKIYHRLGIGTQIVNRMKSKINEERTCLIYDVPESNLSIQLFLKNNSFKANLIKKYNENVLRFKHEGE